MYNRLRDIELWNASMEGDQQAFGQLFRRYYSLLFQYGNKICADTVVLEDCIQELFTELWHKRPGLVLQSVKAYLLQALKFKLYKSFRERKFSYDMNENSVFELSYESFLIDKEETLEKTTSIISAMNTLPARQKEVIYLKIYKGLSYEEVSAIMDINYQVVRNLLCQALKALRKLIHPLIFLGLSLLHS
ncbi:MAG: sigma-70 family RNA polymerase sigma factor [Chitinophagaceae bacterium]|nr:sigma-70 family RNA polymerase sigma factor [Chitinophagaceae bacterium]